MAKQNKTSTKTDGSLQPPRIFLLLDDEMKAGDEQLIECDAAKALSSVQPYDFNDDDVVFVVEYELVKVTRYVLRTQWCAEPN